MIHYLAPITCYLLYKRSHTCHQLSVNFISLFSPVIILEWSYYFQFSVYFPESEINPRDPPINTSVRQALQPPISTQIQLSNSHPPPSITVPSSVYLIVDLMRTLPLPSITVPQLCVSDCISDRDSHGWCHNTLSPLNSSFKWLQTANLFITTQIMRLNHRLKIPGLYEPEIYCFRCYLYLLPITPDWLRSYCPIVHFNTMLPTSTFCFHYPQSFPELRIDFFFFSVFVIFFSREILTF